MKKTIFHHARCPVCVSVELEILSLIDKSQVEGVHLGDARNRIREAEKAGVKSVPALAIPNGNVLHINYGKHPWLMLRVNVLQTSY